MTQLPSPQIRRVLIIEDEFLIALDLEETMFKLGFDVCALAPSARKARSLAMHNPPDVALVDVCLEGGREGIEIARWLREVCQVPIVFVTAQRDAATVERIHSGGSDQPLAAACEPQRRQHSAPLPQVLSSVHQFRLQTRALGTRHPIYTEPVWLTGRGPPSWILLVIEAT
jgi:DNA-binding NarL/FixJ family response regulator